VQLTPVLVFADQFSNVLAAGAKPTLADLLINERLECFGEGNVHRAHAASLDILAKFGKIQTIFRSTLTKCCA
jgi:hypothetical protein